MITRYPASRHGRTNHGWLQSCFHFSFAEYYNPARVQFGCLRVINDDLIAAGTGFDTHPHRDMEIISYVVNGELSHTDNMGNQRSIGRGEVQYMSAGTGVAHSEYNLGQVTTRLLQIWIIPDRRGYTPNYGDYAFPWQARQNHWLHLVSPTGGTAPVKIHQDANIHALALDQGKTIDFSVTPGRQAYLVLIEGSCTVNGILLGAQDGLETVGESLVIQASETSHLLLIEMMAG